MGNVTQNLSRHEFACDCGCGFDTIDYELAVTIQDAIFYFEHKYQCKVIVDISGGNRCQKHNANTKGAAKGSKHQYGIAADHKFFKIVDGVKTQISPQIVYDYYDEKYNDKFGIGIYSNRVHLDVRAKKARWDSR
jgi:uncharacterized protein YcbK (DUF882 family)